MSKNTEARKRFLETAFLNSVRATEYFSALMKLAQRIYEAEEVGFVIDPDSVERAVKNVLGIK